MKIIEVDGTVTQARGTLNREDGRVNVNGSVYDGTREVEREVEENGKRVKKMVVEEIWQTGCVSIPECRVDRIEDA